MNPKRKATSVTEIERWLRDRFAMALRVPATEVPRTEALHELGVDSLAIVQITGEVGEWLQCVVDPSVAYEHPTIARLAEYLASIHEESRFV